jgi:alpha-L-arabinofuranosidase
MIGRWLTSRWTIFVAGLLLGSVFLNRLWDEASSELHAEEMVNFLPNGSFESDGPGPAGADWVFDERKMKKKGTIARVDQPVGEGAKGLQFIPAAANAQAGAEPLGVGQIIPYAKIGVGQLSLSASLGAEGGASVTVGVVGLRRNGSEVARGAITTNQGGAELALSSTMIEFKKPKDVAQLLVFVVAGGGSGKAFVDGIVIAPAKAAGAVLEDDEPMTAEIRVDAVRVIRPIPRTLFGTNVEWIDNGNGILDPRTGRFDETVIRLAREAGVSQIRYPGGLFSDHFHWKESIGPRERRPMKQHYPKGPSSKLNLGTDEAIELASKMDAELFITANAGSGTAEEAAEWVRYFQTKGKVRYWEVGNELYMKSFDANSPPAFDTTPAAYADQVVAFAEAMRKVEPTLLIGAIGADNFTTFPLTDHPQWTKTVLSRASGSIDFLAVHNAYAPLVVDGKGNPGDIYLAMLAAPVHIRQSLAKVSKLIDQTPPRDAQRIKLAVTEWGPFFSVGPTAPYLDHPKTLGSALFVASTMKVFLESPRVEIAHFFKLSEPTFMGWIGPHNKKMIPKAPLFALEIFAKHFGTELVESATTSPTFDAPAAGLMPSASKVPWFEVVASKDSSGRVFLVGINKHFTQPMKAKINLVGFEPTRTGAAWTLTGTGIDAHTGTELPRIPGLTWARQMEIPPSKRMNKGNPSEVTLTQQRVTIEGPTFEYTFPARSVTSIEMTSAGAARP